MVCDVCLTNIQHLWWIQATEVQRVIGIVGWDWHLPRDGSICFSGICSNLHGRWALNVWRLDICSRNKRRLHQSIQEMQLRLIYDFFLALFVPKQKENQTHIFFGAFQSFSSYTTNCQADPLNTEMKSKMTLHPNFKGEFNSDHCVKLKIWLIMMTLTLKRGRN